MKNYDEMSDFEVNKEVAKLCLPCDYVLDDKGEKVDLVGYCTYLGAHGVPDERLEKYGEFDPCNNPSDAWPIIIENKIDISHTVSGHINCAVFKPDEKGMYREFYTTVCENPLRAAMICFLKMKDAES